MGSRPANEVICFDMTIDPICGMTVDEASVPRAERDGPAFCFCGDHCRQKFLPTLPTATHEQKPQGKAIYVCPMHPEVQQEHPGACPKCGMALEPKTMTRLMVRQRGRGTDTRRSASPSMPLSVIARCPNAFCVMSQF